MRGRTTATPCLPAVAIAECVPGKVGAGHDVSAVAENLRAPVRPLAFVSSRPVVEVEGVGRRWRCWGPAGVEGEGAPHTRERERAAYEREGRAMCEIERGREITLSEEA